MPAYTLTHTHTHIHGHARGTRERVRSHKTHFALLSNGGVYVRSSASAPNIWDDFDSTQWKKKRAKQNKTRTEWAK